MNPAKIIGIILIVGGCLGIAIPLIASAAAVALGIFLLVGVGRK
jgi:hypothetical protein